MPLVSVIVPVYKVEPYLRRCVDSILAQTFTDLELILVDDGSPDKCGAICDEYAAQDTRIHVIHQDNGGLSAARNAGLDWTFSNSNSEWISFVDSDDWVHPQFLEYLYRGNLEAGTQICACGYTCFSNEEEVTIQKLELKAILTTPEHIYTKGGRGIYAHVWNKLYAKKLWYGIRFPEGRIWEDIATTYKVLFAVTQVAAVESELYFYFINSNGIVLQAWTEKKLDNIWAIKEALKDSIINKKPLLTQLFYKEYISALIIQSMQVRDSTNLSIKEKHSFQKRIQKELRRTLVTKGKVAQISIKSNRWYYEFAFPKLSWLYWTGAGFFGKIKRIFRKQE